MSKALPLDWHKRRSGKGMSAKAELVLNVLYSQFAIGNSVSMQVMELSKAIQNLGICSMVSGHIALTWLKDNGYVKLLQSSEDRRIKTVELTAKGKGYFA